MRYLIFLLLVVIAHSSIAQVSFDRQSHDFGDIERGDSTYVDFSFRNNGNTTEYILSIRKDDYVSYKLTSQKIEPGATELLRVNYTPRRKGRFNENIEVIVGSDPNPIELTISGNVRFVDPDAILGCPDFINPMSTVDFKLAVNVIDKNTGKPIDDAKVKVINRGRKKHEWFTNRDGMTEHRVTPDQYYFVVSAEGYSNAENSFYVNKQNKYIQFEMEQEVVVATVEEVKEEAKEEEPEPEPIPEVVIDTEENPEATEEVEEIEDTEEIIEEEEIAEVEPEVEEDPEPEEEPEPEPEEEPEPEIEEDENLPESVYAPNNVVFLIDVSTSMNKDGKLDLLKSSMIQLVDILRPIDKVSLVTYADKPTVVLSGVSASRKDELVEIIEGLEAKGLTAGNKGIKRAYKTAFDHKIDDGNNQILLATDGAFKNSVKKIYPLVMFNTIRGMKLSVVGIKNRKGDAESMEKLANKGGGDYIHIDSYNSSEQALIDEIKMKSKIQ